MKSMNENNKQNPDSIPDYGEEIDIKELVTALWKKKVLIVGVAIAGAILAGLISFFLIRPVYNASLNMVISMPEAYCTKYGEYKLPISTNEQYLNLIKSNDIIKNTIREMGYTSREKTIEDIKKAVTINNTAVKADAKQNTFIVTVSADNPNEALRLAEALYHNYIEHVNVMIKEKAIESFYYKYSVELESMEITLDMTKDTLNKNRELLSRVPQTINQKEAIKEIQGQLDNTSYFMILENIINPNYTKLEADILGNEQYIGDLENSMTIYGRYIEELELEKKAMDKYWETGRISKLESDMISIVGNGIYLYSSPVAPSKKTSPNNMMNTAIGGILGGMLAVVIVLIRKYWA